MPKIVQSGVGQTGAAQERFERTPTQVAAADGVPLRVREDQQVVVHLVPFGLHPCAVLVQSLGGECWKGYGPTAALGLGFTEVLATCYLGQLSADCQPAILWIPILPGYSQGLAYAKAKADQDG